MGRNAKKRKAKAQASRASEASAGRIRDQLDRGSTKAALQGAKLLAKSKPGPDADALLLEAYKARAEALLASGMSREAADLLACVAERFPEAELSESAERLAIRSGALDELASRWTEAQHDDARREVLAERLRRYLIDPTALARCTALPSDDPLRRAARAVAAAFREAAEGRLSDEARSGLGHVPRRSPLAPWRHFVLALDAFHRHDDEAMAGFLSRIPEDAAVRPLTRLLEQIAGGSAGAATAPDDSRAVRALLDGLTGGAASLLRTVQALSQEIDRRNRKGATRAICQLAPPLRAFDRDLLRRFVRWLTADPEIPVNPPELSPVLRRALTPAEFSRILALNDERFGALDAFNGWVEWLEPRLPGRPGALSAIEASVMIERLSRLHPAARWEAAHLCREHGAEMADVLLAIRDGDVDAVRYMLSNPNAFEALRFASSEAMLAKRLGELAGAVSPSRRFDEYLAWVALDLAPSNEGYRDHHERFAARGGRQYAQDFLQQWAQRFPRSVEPLLLLARRARRSGALRKALRYLERAEEVSALDPSVRTEQFHVLVASLLRRCKQRKWHLCRDDLKVLDRLPASTTPERRAFLAAVRTHVAVLEGAAPQGAAAGADADAEADRARLDDLCGGRDCAGTLLSLVDCACGRARELVVSGAAAGDRGRTLARVIRIGNSVDVRAVAFAPPPESLGGLDIAGMPDDPGDLDALCEYAAAHRESEWLHAASGRGIAAGGPLLCRFLLFRWRSLEDGGAEAKWADDCRRLAWHQASRDGRKDVVRDIRAWDRATGPDAPEWVERRAADAHRLEEALDPDEAREILERERAYQGPLSERTGRPRQAGVHPSRGGKPRRARSHAPSPSYELAGQQLLPFATDDDDDPTADREAMS